MQSHNSLSLDMITRFFIKFCTPLSRSIYQVSQKSNLFIVVLCQLWLWVAENWQFDQCRENYLVTSLSYKVDTMKSSFLPIFFFGSSFYSTSTYTYITCLYKTINLLRDAKSETNSAFSKCQHSAQKNNLFTTLSPIHRICGKFMAWLM